MKKSIWMLALTLATVLSAHAQLKTNDSIIVHVGQASKVILSIHDRKDLETIKQYDFQALMSDMISKLEKKDTTPSGKSAVTYLRDTTNDDTYKVRSSHGTRRSHTIEGETTRHERDRNFGRRTYHSFNVDIGTNNYLASGKFPDQSNQQYAVRPWGSWYVALNSIQRTHVVGKFFLEWGAGVSWYNFKFEDNKTLLTKDNSTVTFSQDARAVDFQKSKLTASYLNVSFVPVLDFGRGGRKTTIFDGSRVDFSRRGNHSSAFRIGAGPYAGYRIGSYTKQVYEDQGDKKKQHNQDNFYLNNLRYGVRLQFGFDDVDLFFNYDLNNLFVDNKGPKVNAFSFGITF